MAYSHFERLSALDDSFLEIEDGASHMHIGAVALFEAARSRRPDGGIDIERIRAADGGGPPPHPALPAAARSARRSSASRCGSTTRASTSPTTSATRTCRSPGDERQLKRLAGRLMSQQLDRGKPLWEMWVVEGLDGGRFAIITKAHHCMIDGVGSVELTGLGDASDARAAIRARRAAAALDAAARAVAARAVRSPSWRTGSAAPLAAAGGRPRAVVRAARRAVAQRRDDVAGLGEALGTGAHARRRRRRSTSTSGRTAASTGRSTDLAALKAMRTRLGGTVNDVVLAVLAGRARRASSTAGASTPTGSTSAPWCRSTSATRPTRDDARQPGGDDGRPAAARRARSRAAARADRRRDAAGEALAAGARACRRSRS